MANRFSDLESDLFFVINKLLEDKELCKLLYYTSATPLSSPDVPNPNSLVFNKIYPFMKIPEVQETASSIVCVNFSNARLENRQLKNYKLLFNVACHIDLWKISGGLRPYAICNRIDELFNELHGSQISIGRVNFQDWVYREFNQKYTGYYLCYDLTKFN